MKRKLSDLRTALRAGLFIAAAVILAPLVSAQVYPTTYGTFTSVVTGLQTNDVVTVTSSAIDVPQGRGLALVPEFTMVSAATGNVVFTAQVSIDGTNYTTSSGLTHTVAANGTNVVRSLWLLDPTEVAAVRKLRISQISNAANAVRMTNLLVSWSRSLTP